MLKKKVLMTYPPFYSIVLCKFEDKNVKQLTVGRILMLAHKITVLRKKNDTDYVVKIVQILFCLFV